MGSQGGIGNRTSSVGRNQSQESKSGLMVGQGSIYNLTLDEVQNYLGDLGKPLSSMNLDELLNTVWTAEVNQDGGGVDFGTQRHGQFPSTLNRQSSVTLSRDLSKKTVDEVWQDIQQGQKRKRSERKVHDREIALGEITLEDFLVKAGVVAEPLQKKNSESGYVIDSSGFSQQSLQQQAQWMQYQIPSVNQIPPHHQQQHNVMPGFGTGHPAQQPISFGSNPMLDAAYSDTALAASPTTLMGALSDTQTPARKRLPSGQVVERNVERRQKRMIKNRESAARSRARKQAYTNELEIKVTRLEEENEKLKHQNDLETMLPAVSLPEPKYQLRRTSSASF